MFASKGKDTVKKSEDYSIIRNKLGLTSQAPKEKIAFELNRLKDTRIWKVYGISEKDFKQFGVKL
jgi:hypothetical protein|tara:strand:+ start:242 stop:436 length:195 start_codon:yes stop_codon:yes gene_type:complete